MRRVAAAVLLGLLAAGCAASGSPSGSPPTSAPRSAPTSAPPSGSVTVDGVVERGVEPGCFVLRAGSTSYLLLRTDGGQGVLDAPVAVPVRVTGRIVTGVASYCQQGTPLRVDSITRR